MTLLIEILDGYSYFRPLKLEYPKKTNNPNDSPKRRTFGLFLYVNNQNFDAVLQLGKIQSYGYILVEGFAPICNNFFNYYPR